MGLVFDAIKRASTFNKDVIDHPQAKRNGKVHKHSGDDGWRRQRETASKTGAVLPHAATAHASRLTNVATHQLSPFGVESHLVAVKDPRSPHCERFRTLRTKLLEAGERRQMRAFVISSAGVGEGKTLTSLNLGWMLAQTDGLQALIIDSDLRHPCATRYLGIKRPRGLSDLLVGKTTLEEAIVRLDPAGLFLLPGGAAREDVAELLSGPAYDRILSEARELFDYILIDAPPLGIFTDANVLMNHADGALIVVRAGKTRYALIDRLLEQIPREKLLGVVLNCVDEQFDEASYYYPREYYARRTGELGINDVISEGREEVAITG